MNREHGNLHGQRVQVKSGEYDGAEGVLLDRVVRDGVRFMEIQLDSGETVLVADKSIVEKSSGTMPRELGVNE